MTTVPARPIASRATITAGINLMGLFPGKFKKLAEKNAPTAQKAAGHVPYKNIIKKQNLTPHILPAGGTGVINWVKESLSSTGRFGKSR